MRTRGKWFKKEHWYSICSRHHDYDENCNLCNTGMWHNVYITKISSFIFDIFPKLWIKYTNKK